MQVQSMIRAHSVVRFGPELLRFLRWSYFQEWWPRSTCRRAETRGRRARRSRWG